MLIHGSFQNAGNDGAWSKLFQLTLVLLAMACFSSAQTQTTPAPEAPTGIEGVITVGPIHGGPARIGVPDSKPLANTIFVVENDKGALASFTTDGDGRFQISLAPGHYKVSRRDAQPKVGRYGPFDVDVAAGQMTKVAWSCDSGMR